MVAKGFIAGLNINPMSKSKFCLACTKEKMSCHPLLKKELVSKQRNMVKSYIQSFGDLLKFSLLAQSHTMSVTQMTTHVRPK